MHTGWDSTLARGRHKFWVTQGTMLSKMVVQSWTEKRSSPFLSADGAAVFGEVITSSTIFFSDARSLRPYAIRG